MEGLGLPAGTRGVVAAYDGLLDELVIDIADSADQELDLPDVEVRPLPTRMNSAEDAETLAERILRR